jgi:hypothetical protein
MRLKLQKRSEWKFVSRIIPHKQVFNTPQLTAKPVSKACFGVPVIMANISQGQNHRGCHCRNILLPKSCRQTGCQEQGHNHHYFQ